MGERANGPVYLMPGDKSDQHVRTTSEASEETLPQQENRSLTPRDFTHLFVMAIIAGLAAIYLFVLINGSVALEFGRFLIAPLLVSLASASLFLVAAWSVLGVGSYLSRLVWAHFAGAIVMLGYLVGLAPVFGGDDSPLRLWRFCSLVVLLTPLFSLAAQLPLWCFRLFFGWQFTFRESPPVQSFTLRDVFMFTFLCALALATSQYAADRLTDWYWADDKWLSVLGGQALLVCGIFLLCVPALTISFWTKETAAACATMAMYSVIWIFLTVIATSMFGSSPPPAEFLGIVSVLFASFAALISVPFMISKANGFRLTSHRRYRKSSDQPTHP